MKKADRHGVFNIPENEKGMWMCSYKNCHAKADFIKHEEFDKKENTQIKQGGICRKHALEWQKDCKTCLAKINNTA